MTSEKSIESKIEMPSQPTTPAAIKISVAAFQESLIAGKTAAEPYDPNTSLDDIPAVRRALQLFLESKMVESEELLDEKDPAK